MRHEVAVSGYPSASRDLLTDGEIEDLVASVAVGVREASTAEGWAIFDGAARRYLHMTGEAFIEQWRAGKFEDSDRPEVLRVAMLVPFAGQQPR